VKVRLPLYNEPQVVERLQRGGGALDYLANNLSYPLMVAPSLPFFPAVMTRRGVAAWQLLAIDLPLFAAATGSVLL
jgi:hypothetical protein